MKLYIAEKPSLGRAVAQALEQKQGQGKQCEGYIAFANGDCVSWCIGHLLEQAEPEHYDPAFKKWQLAHLPIVPDKWQLKVKANTRKQFSILKKLIVKAEQLVHVGDPDREGQLLVDEVINHCRISKAKRDRVLRCLINDLTPSAVQKSLNKLRPNGEFVALSTSALARARADWLYGLNMTRLCTLQGQQSGYQGVLSIGRVQTPVLGLVVARDLEIENFVSKPFYQVDAHISASFDNPDLLFKARWQPSKACEPYRDEEGRVLSKALAQNVCARIEQQVATVLKCSEQHKQQAAPLAYNLSALQIDAAKIFGFSAKQVLDGAQRLYEQYQLITYPRSDCRYLPQAQRREAGAVLAAAQQGIERLAGNAPNEQQQRLLAGFTQADLKHNSKVWNDSKVGAHHAIIPTAKAASNLSGIEAALYQLIARQYLMQFLPPMRYSQSQIDCQIGSGLFIAKQKQVLDLGWQQLIKSPSEQAQALPKLEPGAELFCQRGELLEKQTSPPAYFTDATLLAAMTGIARFVSDGELKKVLRDTDGIGTEATRAGIIELLFKRGYLERGRFQAEDEAAGAEPAKAKTGKQGKQIRSSQVARELIQALPDSIGRADMTAHWELQLESISQQQLSYGVFMQQMQASLEALIDEVSSLRLTLPASPAKGQNSRYKQGGYKKSTAGSGTKSGAKNKKARAKRPRARSA